MSRVYNKNLSRPTCSWRIGECGDCQMIVLRSCTESDVTHRASLNDEAEDTISSVRKAKDINDCFLEMCTHPDF